MDRNYCGFSKKLIPALVCQEDNGRLILREDIGNDKVVFEGVLKCESCSREYFIKKGILMTLSEQNNLPDDIQSEIDARNKEAHKYDKRLSVRYYKEIPSTLRQIGKTKKIIEYACGTGRLSTELDYEEFLGVDFSIESLVILSHKLRNNENIGLVLADAINFKTKNNFFDTAFSAQFIEHIPTEEMRSAFLENAFNTLKSNGDFVSSVYHYDLRKRIKKEKQEGYHKSGVFFHYFTIKELKKYISTMYNNFDIRPIDITLPLEARVKMPVKLGGLLSRLCEYIPVVKKLGHLLIIKAEKKSNKQKGEYCYGLVFPWLLRKYWFWFQKPRNIKGAAMVNFFSYNRVDLEGFNCKEGKTVVVDLQPDLNFIWQNMRQKFICKQIVKGEKNGIVVRLGGNLKDFREIYKNFRKQKGLAKDRLDIIFKKGINFSAFYEGKLVSIGIFISDGMNIRALVLSSVRYKGGGKYRDIIGQANRMLIWEAIKWAKENGYRIFDLGGISAPNKDGKYDSLAEFKMSFGGEIKPCFYYHRVYSPLLKIMMKIRGFKV